MKAPQEIRVLLCGAEEEENLGLRYIASSLLAAGHRVTLLPIPQQQTMKEFETRAAKAAPNLIGIPMPFQSKAGRSFAVIRALRKICPDSHLTVGGHFPTFEFREILQRFPEIDSIIRFEGEEAMVALANLLGASAGDSSATSFAGVPNLVWRSNGLLRENPIKKTFPDLEALPFPLRDAEPSLRMGEKFATLVTSRGCHHSSCVYCCIGAFHRAKTGELFRLRSSESVAEEMADLYHRLGVRVFQLHDDNFTLPDPDQTLQRIDSLRRAFLDRKINPETIALMVKARPETISREVAQGFRELGVTGVFLGIENVSPSGARALGRGTAPETAVRALDLLEAVDIAPTFNLLIFHPQATMKEIDENLAFMEASSRIPWNFGRTEIVAAAPLEALVKKEGLMLGEWPAWSYRIPDSAVEDLYQRVRKVFFHPGGGFIKAAHTMVSVAYQMKILKKFYPGRVMQALCDESALLVEDAGTLFHRYLTTLRNRQSDVLSEDDLHSMRREFDAECRRLLHRVRRLGLRALRLRAIEQWSIRLQVPGWFQDSFLARYVVG